MIVSTTKETPIFYVETTYRLGLKVHIKIYITDQQISYTDYD